MIKMIVTDLDGTLLNSERKINEETKNYFRNLRQKGYIIVIATGRIYESAKVATEGLDFADYIIADAGSLIYDLKKESIIYKNQINIETAKEFKDFYDNNSNYINLCTKDKIYSYSSENKFFNEYFIESVNDWDEIFKQNIEVLHITLTVNSNEVIEDIKKNLEKNFNNLSINVMRDSFAERKWFEITSKGVDKYEAILRLSKLLAIKNEEIIAFGDGLNDIEMIKNSGTGVALINALEEVKKEADFLTKYDNSNNGVIKFLKDYLNE